jgi:FkbM family methyltransferase
MSFRKNIASIPFIRRAVIGVLKFFGRDITLTNGWTGDRIRLNTYLHKGYWLFGKSREAETMHAFKRLVRAGDTVIEVGGHIGYIAQYFSKLVGSEGRLIVFEPGSNNLRYIEENLRGCVNTTLERLAVGSTNGKAIFYEDNLSGQNNSLLGDYKMADSVSRAAGQELVRTPRAVQVVTLDMYVTSTALQPDFMKIDVEGFELEVLKGSQHTLQMVRAFMVEVTEQHDEVGALILAAGFRMKDEAGNCIDRIATSGNIFAER